MSNFRFNPITQKLDIQRSIANIRSMFSIDSGSTSFLDYDDDTGKFSVKQLLIVDVITDGVSANLSTALVSAGYSPSNITSFQKGDFLILTVPSLLYIHNGGTAGTTSDFTLVETPPLTTSQTRALFSSVSPYISYNASNGQFSDLFTTILSASGSTYVIPSLTTYETYISVTPSVTTTITLPTVSSSDIGKKIIIKDIEGTSSAINVAINGTSIDRSTSTLLNSNDSSKTLLIIAANSFKII